MVYGLLLLTDSVRYGMHHHHHHTPCNITCVCKTRLNDKKTPIIISISLDCNEEKSSPKRTFAIPLTSCVERDQCSPGNPDRSISIAA